VLPASATSTGYTATDIVEYIKILLMSRGGDLGMMIMMLCGFAAYMTHIGANDMVVKLASKPLQYINSPYLLMVAAYFLACLMSLAVSSATGLGVLLIYAVSGFMLNHKRDFNSDYSVRRTELVFAQEIPRAEQEWTRARAEELLLRVGEEGNYLKHYFPEPDRLKVFIRGGSSLTVDLASGHAVYESIRKRPVLSSLNRLHYNPSRWWTVFSDVFLAGLIVIVLSGLVMMRGPKGLRGRGGVELIAGILIPLLFIFLT
jgi:hypothetical protein